MMTSIYSTSNYQTISSFPGAPHLCHHSYPDSENLKNIFAAYTLCWKSTAPDLLKLPKKRNYILDTFLFARKCLLLGNVKNRETSEHMAFSTPQQGLCFCGVTFHIVGLCLRCTGPQLLVCEVGYQDLMSFKERVLEIIHFGGIQNNQNSHGC